MSLVIFPSEWCRQFIRTNRVAASPQHEIHSGTGRGGNLWEKSVRLWCVRGAANGTESTDWLNNNCNGGYANGQAGGILAPNTIYATIVLNVI